MAMSGYLGSTPENFKYPLNFVDGVNAYAITSNETITIKSGLIFSVNGGVSDRNITCDYDTGTNVEGRVHIVKNSGPTNTITIKRAATTTLIALAPGEWAIIANYGADWMAMPITATTAGLLAALNVWSALQTFGAGAAMKDSLSYFYDDGDATKKLAFQASGIATGNTRTLTAPDASGTLALLSLAQTFSALQTFGAGTAITGPVTFKDSSDPTKILALAMSTIATGTTRTATMPDASGTLALLSLAQTWSALQTFSSGIAGKLDAPSLFVSTEQTGNGSSQNVAHGLSATPTRVLIAATQSGGAFTITEGTHTSSNVVVTVSNGIKYKVLAAL